MALTNAALNVAGDALAAAATHLSIHTAEPSTAGSNESSAARQPAGWTVLNGDLSTSDINFTGGAAGGMATHVGLWSAATSGTFYGFFTLTGDTTFNSAGEYKVTSLVVDASAA